jgi:DNA-binding GntR family transcriptional regulator
VPLPSFSIDRRSPVPLYYQVSTQLMSAIESGDLAPGERLPNEAEFAIALGVSRPTMRQALNELVQRGILIRQRGTGTRIAGREVRRQVELTSLFEDLAAAGQRPATKVLAFTAACPNVPAAARDGLQVGQDEGVVYCMRLRLADGKPIAILRNWLPASRFADITAQALQTRGLYQLMDERGGRPAVARQRITARIATPEQARLLKMKTGGALVTMERTAYAANGTAVEFADNVYRADLYAIESTVYDR